MQFRHLMRDAFAASTLPTVAKLTQESSTLV